MHTPLHLACMYNQGRVVAELLKKLSSVEGSVSVPDKVTYVLHWYQCLSRTQSDVGLNPNPGSSNNDYAVHVSLLSLHAH